MSIVINRYEYFTVIRCKDLSRANGGSINAYVKVCVYSFLESILSNYNQCTESEL